MVALAASVRRILSESGGVEELIELTAENAGPISNSAFWKAPGRSRSWAVACQNTVLLAETPQLPAGVETGAGQAARGAGLVLGSQPDFPRVGCVIFARPWLPPQSVPEVWFEDRITAFRHDGGPSRNAHVEVAPDGR